MSHMMASRRAISAYGAGAPAPDNRDPAAILADLQKTFHDFQAANDERLKQVEKRGEDAVTRDQVEKINAQITTLKDSFDTQAKALGRLTVGGSGANDNARAAENARIFLATAGGKRIRRATPEQIEAYGNYAEGFSELVRASMSLDHIPDDYRAAMSIGSDRDGGYLVPTEMSSEMERRIYDTSPMRQFARVITIGRSAWEAPYFSGQGTSGGWVGERQSRPATGTPQVGVQRIETHTQYAYPEVTEDMLDDAAMDVEGFITEETYAVMARTENTGFVSGDGNMKPRGFLSYKDTAVTTKDASRSWGTLQYIGTGAAGGLPTLTSGATNADALIDTITALHPNYRAGATWAMNRSTEAELRKAKDAEGRYLVGMGSIEGGLAFNLFGYGIANFEDMPDLASDSFSVAFANFNRGYYIIDRRGFRLLRDNVTNKPYVGFYITKRVGGDVRNFDAIKLVKFG